jgi:hypothetical protein
MREGHRRNARQQCAPGAIVLLAPDLSAVRLARYSASFFPRNGRHPFPAERPCWPPSRTSMTTWASGRRRPISASPSGSAGFRRLPGSRAGGNLHRLGRELHRVPDGDGPACDHGEPAGRPRDGVPRAARRLGAPVHAHRPAPRQNPRDNRTVIPPRPARAKGVTAMPEITRHQLGTAQGDGVLQCDHARGVPGPREKPSDSGIGRKCPSNRGVLTLKLSWQV